MPIEINPESLASAKRTFSSAFRDGLVGQTTNTHEAITQQIPMTTGIIDLPMIGNIRGLRRWTGERQYQALKATGYQMESEIFEDSVEVPRKAIEDDNWGLYNGAMKMLGQKTAEFPDQLVFEKLEKGETEKGLDKVPFFSASHPIGSTGQVFSNLSGSGSPAWYLFDTSKVFKPMLIGNHVAPEFASRDKPDSDNVFEKDMLQYGVRVRKGVQFGIHHLAYKSKAALDATTFDAAVTTMMQYKDEHGESLGVLPRVLYIPPVLRAAARAILEVEYLANGASNPNFGFVKVVISDRLSNVA